MASMWKRCRIFFLRTRILLFTMMNKTDWDKFAEETGATLDDLSTVEGIAKVAEQYYDWTDAQTPDVPDDGKAFYGRDSMSNYFLIGMKQMVEMQ